MIPFDPAIAVGQRFLSGIDPASLFSNRDELEQWRLNVQRDLIAKGIKRLTPIQVNREGVIINGNHGVRAAAEAGVAIDVEIINCPHPHFGPILTLPIVDR